MPWWIYPLIAWCAIATGVTINWQRRHLRNSQHKAGLFAGCALMVLLILPFWWVLLEPWRTDDPGDLARSYELHENGLKGISLCFTIVLIIFIILEINSFHWDYVVGILVALAFTLLVGVNHAIKLDKISEKIGELPLNDRQAAYSVYVKKLGGRDTRAADARNNFGLPG